MDKNQLLNYKGNLIKDSLLYRLINYFENDEDRFLRILTAIEEVIYDKDHRQILNALNIVHPHHPDYKKLTGKEIPKSNAKLHTFYNWAIQFHSLFDVPTRFLGFPNDDIVEKYLEKRPKIESHFLPLTDFYHDVPRNRNNQIKAYKQLNSKLLKKIKYKLCIYDYLLRYNHMIKDPYGEQYFNNAHIDDYSEIENIMMPPDGNVDGIYEYVRLLVLPPGHPNIVPYHTNYQNETNLLSIKKEVCRLVSYPLFEHICDTLTSHPYFELPCEIDDYVNDNTSGFYMIAYPTRNYSYAYIDGIEWFLKETYSLTKERRCMLEMLSLEKSNDYNSDRVHLYKNEINMIILGNESSGVIGAPKFTLGGLPELILDILEEYVIHGGYSTSRYESREKRLFSTVEYNYITKDLIKKYHKANEALSAQSL